MLFGATLNSVLKQAHIREWNNAITIKTYFYMELELCA